MPADNIYPLAPGNRQELSAFDACHACAFLPLAIGISLQINGYPAATCIE